MRKVLCALVVSVISLTLLAAPQFQQGKSYHIVCLEHAGGCVADGKLSGQTTPLYYLANATTAAETYWTISEEQPGQYSIRNVRTGQYVTYDGVRSDSPVRRYVSMTDTRNGTKSLWTFAPQSGNGYVIQNVGQPDHVWDVRSPSTSTPYVVGTYSRTGGYGTNQLFNIYDESGKAVKEEERDLLYTPLSAALGTLLIDARCPLYVSDQHYLLCPVAASHFGTSPTLTVGYQASEGWGTLTIDGTAVANGASYTFSNVSAGKTYTLSISHADGTTVSCPLTFTSLAVVSLQGTFGYDYTEGDIVVQEPDKPQYTPAHMKAKWRGGITNQGDKHKRNYHVKFLDGEGQKLEQKFFGLRNDNSWILESCQVDMSRIRNRVLTDLWNDFATKPYYIDQEPKALSGTRGRFAELILNGEYRGIYCLTEAMDRKQMKLKKHDDETGTMHGQLWKSKDWSYAVFMGHHVDNNSYPKTSPAAYDNHSESWDQYYVKYPDIEDVNPTQWSVLWNAVNFVCTSTDANFKAHISEYFDLPVVIDYYILMETILSSDNHGKNMYFAVYDKQQDKKITFGVWDMDATTGQRWSDAYYHSTIMKPEQSYATYIANNEHGDYNLFRRLRLTNAADFNMQVRLRYRDLRQTYLQTEAILDRFRTQRAAFKTCGADQREYRKWSGDSDIAGKTLNFDTEQAYIEDWVKRRMNYLDKTQFKIAELPPTGIQQLTTSPAPAAHGIYTTDGRRVGSATDTRSLRQLPPGLYIVNGQKVAVGR